MSDDQILIEQTKADETKGLLGISTLVTLFSVGTLTYVYFHWYSRTLSEKESKTLVLISAICSALATFVFLYSVFWVSYWYSKIQDFISNKRRQIGRAWEDYKTSWYQGSLFRVFRVIVIAFNLLVNLVCLALVYMLVDATLKFATTS